MYFAVFEILTNPPIQSAKRTKVNVHNINPKDELLKMSFKSQDRFKSKNVVDITRIRNIKSCAHYPSSTKQQKTRKKEVEMKGAKL